MPFKRLSLLLQSRRAAKALEDVRMRPAPAQGVLVFATLRNEMERLEAFLSHYRAMGAAHFFMIDNGSEDGSRAYLEGQTDVSLWHTGASYRASRFGMLWMNALLARYGIGRWCLIVDIDELLVLPNEQDQNLPKFCAALDERDVNVMGALMIDLFPKGPVGNMTAALRHDPIAHLSWFDPTPYRRTYQEKHRNMWIQGGIRERVFFADRRQMAPTLSKIPLIKWKAGYAYVNSTHSILPRVLNRALGPNASGLPIGALLHTKFLPSIVAKSQEELRRGQHFRNPDQYRFYHERLAQNPDLWFEGAREYQGPAQLMRLGFMQPLEG